MKSTLFRNRTQAGEQLAELVATAVAEESTSVMVPLAIVYALPRGGIPVAVPVARRLGCPLQAIVSKKITLPSQPELAIGAVTPDGEVRWSPYARRWGTNATVLEQAKEKARAQAIAQQQEFAHCCPTQDVRGKIAILVDDGLATGMTMATAAASMQARQSDRVWIAAPVAPRDLMAPPPTWGDRFFILETPQPFLNVGRFYEHFPQVETQEAIAYLQEYAREFQGSE